jgi:hypothetical protein
MFAATMLNVVLAAVLLLAQVLFCVYTDWAQPSRNKFRAQTGESRNGLDHNVLILLFTAW